MLLETILLPLVIIILLLSSYTDIKTREVPDMLSHGLIAAGLGIRLLFSVEYGYTIFFAGILGIAATSLIAFTFYFSEQWGGGDTKLLLGMGAAIGIAYPFSLESFTLALFFLTLLLFGALWGVFWIARLALHNRRRFTEQFLLLLQKQQRLHLATIVATLLLAILTYINPLLWPLLLFPLPFYYLFLTVTVAEKQLFTKRVSPSKLTPGDWLAQDVTHKSKLLLHKKTLTPEDIATLQHLPFVTIKEGIPFVPSFLFAYIFITFGMAIIQKLFI